MSAQEFLLAETWAVASGRTNRGGPQTQGEGAAMALPCPGLRCGEAATQLAPCPCPSDSPPSWILPGGAGGEERVQEKLRLEGYS